MYDSAKMIDGLYHRTIATGNTIADLCERAGITKQAFYSWRRGESDPTLKNFHAVLTIVNQFELEKLNVKEESGGNAKERE